MPADSKARSKVVTWSLLALSGLGGSLGIAHESLASESPLNVQCLLAKISEGLASNRKLLKWQEFKNALLRALPPGGLSAREEKFARLWFAIVRPENLEYLSQSDSIRQDLPSTSLWPEYLDWEVRMKDSHLQSDIEPLKKAVEYFRANPAETHARPVIRQLMQSFGMLGAYSRSDLEILISKFTGDDRNNPAENWNHWRSDPASLVSALENQSVQGAPLRIDRQLGSRLATALEGLPAFRELRQKDPDFAAKVLWLKRRSTDAERFKSSFASLIAKVDSHYQRLLRLSERERAGYEDESQVILKHVLMRRALHAGCRGDGRRPRAQGVQHG